VQIEHNYGIIDLPTPIKETKWKSTTGRSFSLTSLTDLLVPWSFERQSSVPDARVKRCRVDNYTWYFTWAGRWSSQLAGLDYGYINRVEGQRGMYEMTALGREYLNSVKKPYQGSTRISRS
tara:strand:- start:3074 stop:3436 length:363 start_codon:yes stop_codon:yes gene_type:complete